MNNFLQEIENNYNQWIKKYPKVGTGGNVMEDAEAIYSILLPILKKNIQIAEIGVWTGKTSILCASHKPF